MKIIKCACETRWVVDFGDDRGVTPTTAIVAALASAIGLRVTLESVSTTPVRRIYGLAYAGSNAYVSKSCATCTYPIEVRNVKTERVVARVATDKELLIRRRK